ncbi:class I SAM-dependent methyltransferase [Opitutus sp. GAS368]|uniref:class I SAM-dependent methyltransferase n=1 Tax=Opitutus sp. GAS368 TaxID=1882749 RepID=UPI00087A11E1|nr:class I SAM-dependent methyltransferase [Opitutus sp. GAS368]SDS46273.1 Methyltransferase domain-containing protein [Opitutus sp. GAS368]
MKIDTVEFDGERVYPENYTHLRPLLYYHLARYAFAKSLLRRGDKVVDIACGSGYGTYELASIAESVIGVDISSVAIDYARKNFPAGNIEFKIGDAISLDTMLSGSVDAVVSFETIEHLADADQDLFLDAAQKSLSRSGILVISTPNTMVYSGGRATNNPHHLRELTIEQFREKLGKRFGVVQIFGQRKFEGSTAKGLMLLLGNVLVRFWKMNFRGLKFNGDIAQQTGDFEFPSYGLAACPYLIAVCKRPTAAVKE